MAVNHESDRANAYALLSDGDVCSAFYKMSELISRGGHSVDDLYLAGEWALDAGLYQEAIDMLSRSVTESFAESDTWYIESAYLARAYARIMIGEYKMAGDDLAKIDDVIEITWLGNHPKISKETLLGMLRKAGGQPA